VDANNAPRDGRIDVLERWRRDIFGVSAATTQPSR
jgi:hypothetical protein